MQQVVLLAHAVPLHQQIYPLTGIQNTHRATGPLLDGAPAIHRRRLHRRPIRAERHARHSPGIHHPQLHRCVPGPSVQQGRQVPSRPLRADDGARRHRHGAIIPPAAVDQHRIRDGLVPHARPVKEPVEHVRLPAVKPVAHEDESLGVPRPNARPVHDKPPVQPVAPLDFRVAMPPKGAVLVVANGKVVRKVAARRNGALREADGAVHAVEALHPQAVPVYRQALVRLEAIVHVDNDAIPGAGFDCRARERPFPPSRLVSMFLANAWQQRRAGQDKPLTRYTCFSTPSGDMVPSVTFQ